MWTREYRGYYIHGYIEKEECCWNYEGKMIRCVSLRAAKLSISRRITLATKA